MKKSWYSQKTFWLGLSSVVAGAWGLYSKTIPSIEAVQLIIAGFGMIFVRSAINNMIK